MGRPGARALIEVLDDRDGHVRQSLAVARWPLRIGRGLDNDLVLSDPHVAASHLRIEPDERGLMLVAEATRNGVLLGTTPLRGGASTVLAAGGAPIELTVGRTRLRLRLPGHALAPEQPLAPVGTLARRALPVAAAALVSLAGVLFTTYLAADPEGLARAAGAALLVALAGAAVWCGAWALLSKTFTRQAHFGWHLRVFLIASVALLAANNLPALLAFALSWPRLTDFAFVGEIAVGAAALYFHMLAVEPARHRALKWITAACALAGIGVTLWFNVQRTDLFGDELYMSHLFPPALRLAQPVPTERFVDTLATLKPALDKKAREPARGDDAVRSGDDTE